VFPTGLVVRPPPPLPTFHPIFQYLISVPRWAKVGDTVAPNRSDFDPPAPRMDTPCARCALSPDRTVTAPCREVQARQMKLTDRQLCLLVSTHEVYVTEACDQCRKILGPVRFTRSGESSVWCSRLCRDGVEHRAGICRGCGAPLNVQSCSAQTRS
jgi:hypothetical protein